MTSFSTEFPTLLNREWLIEKYLEEGLSPKDIAALIGAKSFQPVRRALLAHGIPLRNQREAQVRKREVDYFTIDPEVLTGCLLGDGSLGIYNRRSNQCSPFFYKKNKFKEHVLYVGSFLFEQNIESRISEVKEKNKGIELTYYRIGSLTHDELKPWYRAWYPEKKSFIKSIPSDIQITKKTLLHWFLDDGCCLYSRKTETKWYPRVVFSSQSFSLEDQEVLVSKISNDLGIASYVEKTNSGTGYRIAIRQQETEVFFNKIGPCPLQCFQYKWKSVKEVEVDIS